MQNAIMIAKFFPKIDGGWNKLPFYYSQVQSCSTSNWLTREVGGAGATLAGATALSGHTLGPSCPAAPPSSAAAQLWAPLLHHAMQVLWAPSTVGWAAPPSSWGGGMQQKPGKVGRALSQWLAAARAIRVAAGMWEPYVNPLQATNS